jgi:hypothetical protein
LLLLTFCALLPRISLPPKHTATSFSAMCGGLCAAVAQVSASIRFWRASLRGLASGSWLPASN